MNILGDSEFPKQILGLSVRCLGPKTLLQTSDSKKQSLISSLGYYMSLNLIGKHTDAAPPPGRPSGLTNLIQAFE